MFVLEIRYSVLSATAGSFFAAINAGIKLAMRSKIALKAISAIAVSGFKVAIVETPTRLFNTAFIILEFDYLFL